MKSLTTVLATLALSAAFAVAADEKPATKADKPKRSPEEAFKKLDANSDGSVTAEEFKAGPLAKRAPDRADAFFKSHDKDNDGKLSLEEYKTRPAKKEKAQ
jgi:Ca2+-binding EF-hand superfamily protein